MILLFFGCSGHFFRIKSSWEYFYNRVWRENLSKIIILGLLLRNRRSVIYNRVCLLREGEGLKSFLLKNGKILRVSSHYRRNKRICSTPGNFILKPQSLFTNLIKETSPQFSFSHSAFISKVKPSEVLETTVEHRDKGVN